MMRFFSSKLTISLNKMLRLTMANYDTTFSLLLADKKLTEVAGSYIHVHVCNYTFSEFEVHKLGDVDSTKCSSDSVVTLCENSRRRHVLIRHSCRHGRTYQVLHIIIYHIIPGKKKMSIRMW